MRILSPRADKTTHKTNFNLLNPVHCRLLRFNFPFETHKAEIIRLHDGTMSKLCQRETNRKTHSALQQIEKRENEVFIVKYLF